MVQLSFIIFSSHTAETYVICLKNVLANTYCIVSSCPAYFYALKFKIKKLKTKKAAFFH
jgi:hypothetical protein